MAGWDYFFARYLILHPLRFLFDHPFWYYANFYLNNKFLSYLACDCKPCHSGIAISRNYRYGDRNDEVLDVLVPTEACVIHKGPLIYAHGEAGMKMRIVDAVHHPVCSCWLHCLHNRLSNGARK